MFIILLQCWSINIKRLNLEKPDPDPNIWNHGFAARIANIPPGINCKLVHLSTERALQTLYKSKYDLR